jgi:hypothetical protein
VFFSRILGEIPEDFRFGEEDKKKIVKEGRQNESQDFSVV